jgi:CRISPR/Cas system-associated exonuclease Cas4 (RecB family)
MTVLAKSRAIERSSGHLYTYREGTESFGPFPGATAITGLQDSLGGSDGLMNWGINLALDEVERHEWSGEDEWARVRQLALAAKNGPRDLGSNIHDAVDQLNRGQMPTMYRGVEPYVAQYGAALFQKRIQILGSERYVVNTEIGVGGTYDSLVEIDGERGPLDVKSGKEKPSQRLQLAVLSMGQWHGEAGMEAEPMPELSGVGFILLLRPDGYELVRHEITDEDREHVTHLVETFHRIKAWAAQFQPTALREAA